MSDPHRELLPEDVMAISLQAGLRSHFCGCMFILVWILTKTQDPAHLFGVFVLMGASLIVPLVTAGIVAEAVVRLRSYVAVPVPLFTRVCVIVLECACLGWVIIMMSTLTPFGGDVDPPVLTFD